MQPHWGCSCLLMCTIWDGVVSLRRQSASHVHRQQLDLLASAFTFRRKVTHQLLLQVMWQLGFPDFPPSPQALDFQR